MRPSNQDQIFVTLGVVPITMYQLGRAYRHNLRQGTLCKIASAASRWQLNCVNLTDSGFKPSLPR